MKYLLAYFDLFHSATSETIKVQELIMLSAIVSWVISGDAPVSY